MTSLYSKTKGFRLLFFIQQKISKKYPLKTEFFAHVISQKQIPKQQKQFCNNAFHVKTSQSAKFSSILQKNNNRPKML